MGYHCEHFPVQAAVPPEKRLIFSEEAGNDEKGNVIELKLFEIVIPIFIFCKNGDRWLYYTDEFPGIFSCIERKIENVISKFVVFSYVIT